MTTGPALRDTTTTTLRHVVRLLHASTGEPLAGLTARLADPVPGWSVRTTADTAVVIARAGLREPASTPHLLLALAGGATAALLQIPAAPGLPPGCVVVALDAPVVDVRLHPVPMVLEVVLAGVDTGAPRTGATVAARATAGPSPRPTLSLPETAPGTYRSAAVEFTAAFTPLDLLIDTQVLRTLALDFTTTTTRIHLVDST